MATDKPTSPSLDVSETTRTLTTIDLKFGAPADNGGSSIIGYLLYRDQGITGSPFQLIYDGTGKPEMLLYTARDLITSLTYTFRLYSHNKIYTSDDYAQAVVKIGVVPSKPGQPENLFSLYESGKITIGWKAPANNGGWSITSYSVWVDDANGNWPIEPLIIPVNLLTSTDNFLEYQVTELSHSLMYGFYV